MIKAGFGIMQAGQFRQHHQINTATGVERGINRSGNTIDMGITVSPSCHEGDIDLAGQ